MEKTSAPGTTVWLHLRPAVGDLTPGWDAIQTSLRAHSPLALSADHRQGAPSHVAAVGTNLGSRRDPQTPGRPMDPPLRVGPAAKQRGAVRGASNTALVSATFVSSLHLAQCPLAYMRSPKCLGNKNRE